MLYRILADFVVMFHLVFVVFALFGGLLVIKWKWAAWVHLPAVAWAALIEFTGMICPLTPLENLLRNKGGATVYKTGFVEHYIIPLLYPESLNTDMQTALGAIVISINVLIYTYAFWKKTHQQRNSPLS
jgi:hypothetical protein